MRHFLIWGSSSNEIANWKNEGKEPKKYLICPYRSFIIKKIYQKGKECKLKPPKNHWFHNNNSLRSKSLRFFVFWQTSTIQLFQPCWEDWIMYQEVCQIWIRFSMEIPVLNGQRKRTSYWTRMQIYWSDGRVKMPSTEERNTTPRNE